MTQDGIAYVLATLALALMIIGYALRRPAIGFMATLAWIVFAIFMYNQSTVLWDIYYGMFWLGAAASVITVLEALVMRPKKSEQEPEEFIEDEDAKDEWDNRMDNFFKRLERQRYMSNAERRRRSRNRIEDEEVRREEVRRKLRSKQP